jgi:predicted molibdopterin-dependent oxidoreductase YjgC
MTAIRVPQFERGDAFEIEVDGKLVPAYAGETIASVLLAAGMRAFHQNLPDKAPSRLYCGMGVCMQCLVTVDGTHSCQACKTLARPGMKVETRP